MSESLIPNGNTIIVPHSLEEIWGYFRCKEDIDLRYKGYADIAAQAADTIQAARSRRPNEEPLAIDIAMIPGRTNGIYTHEFTKASRELQEIIFAVCDLRSMTDETISYGEAEDNNPNNDETSILRSGRIWWQSMDTTQPINIIETRTKNDQGLIIRLTAVSDVPIDLISYNPSRKAYDKQTERAIMHSRAMQRLASRAVSSAREAELDYYVLVRDLPKAEFESPYDIAA